MRIGLSCLLMLMLAAPLRAQEAPAPEWVRQDSLTSRFYFDVLAESADGRAGVKLVRVITRDAGTVHQEIAVDGDPGFNAGLARLLSVVDANFDGHPDFSVQLSDGGAGPNSVRAYYLFDPRLGMFVQDAFLSELPQSSINADGTVTSAARGSCCQHGSHTYRYIGGKYVMVASVEVSWSHDGKWVDTSRCTLRRGKMRCITSRKRQPGQEG